MYSILSDKTILSEIQKGPEKSAVVITPFNLNNLSSSSYDVTLGEHFYRVDKTNTGFFCPWNPEHLANYWLKESCIASTILNEEGAKKTGAKIGDKIIKIEPGETILAHTNEFIGGRFNVTTMMKARSGMGRSCTTMCKDAGWGDVGYINRWTYEIQNTGHRTLILIVGERIAQIVFLKTDEVLFPYEAKGSYQNASSFDISAVINAWKPSDMLPKIKRDPPPSFQKVEKSSSETKESPEIYPPVFHSATVASPTPNPKCLSINKPPIPISKPTPQNGSSLSSTQKE